MAQRAPHEGNGNDGRFPGRDALLAAIVESAGDAIIGTDLYGRVLSWNAAATRLYARTQDEMTGEPLGILIPSTDRDRHDALLARLRHDQIREELEAIHRTASGHDIAVTLTASPVHDGNGALAAFAFFIRPRAQPATDDDLNAPPRTGRRPILVVENEPLVGLSLALVLENAGFDVIGPINSASAALSLLERHGCSLAILDVDPGQGETSAPLARRLCEDGIPFLALGGEDAAARPAFFGNGRNVSKPVRARALVAAVHDMLA